VPAKQDKQQDSVWKALFGGTDLMSPMELAEYRRATGEDTPKPEDTAATANAAAAPNAVLEMMNAVYGSSTAPALKSNGAATTPELSPTDLAKLIMKDTMTHITDYSKDLIWALHGKDRSAVAPSDARKSRK